MHELSNAASLCGATATCHEVVRSDIADDDLPPDEWEGKIVGEEIDRDGRLNYMIVWAPTVEPEENVGLEMKKAWEAKKAGMLAPRGDSKHGSRTEKQWAGARGRAKVEKTGSNGGRRGRAKTRPRKD